MDAHGKPCAMARFLRTSQQQGWVAREVRSLFLLQARFAETRNNLSSQKQLTRLKPIVAGVYAVLTLVLFG